MFDYTSSAIEVITKDAKRLLFVLTTVSSFVLAAYYIYASFREGAKLYFTIPLAAISFGYALFLLVTCKIRMDKGKKAVALTYRYIKLGMNAVSLGFTIYEIYLAVYSVKAIDIIFATISLILFLMMSLLSVAILIIEPRAKLFAGAIMKDMEDGVLKHINRINAIKGDEKITFDLSPYAKELEYLRPMAESKKEKRKKDRKDVWDRRFPVRKLFRKKNKDNGEKEDSTKIVESKKR